MKILATVLAVVFVGAVKVIDLLLTPVSWAMREHDAAQQRRVDAYMNMPTDELARRRAYHERARQGLPHISIVEFGPDGSTRRETIDPHRFMGYTAYDTEEDLRDIGKDGL